MHDEVVHVLERLGVEPVVLVEDGLLLGRQALRPALQAVVDSLRDVEELVLPVDDAPLDVETRVAHQRDQGVVDLGDAAAEGGRR